MSGKKEGGEEESMSKPAPPAVASKPVPVSAPPAGSMYASLVDRVMEQTKKKEDESDAPEPPDRKDNDADDDDWA